MRIIQLLKSIKFWTILGSIATVIGVIIAIYTSVQAPSHNTTEVIPNQKQQKNQIAEFNRHPKDLKTLNFLNRTLLEKKHSSEDWKEEIPPVNPGDQIDFYIYYHNSSNTVALDTKVYLSYENCPNNKCTVIKVKIKAVNTPPFLYSKKIIFNNASQLVPINRLIWRPHQTSSGEREIPNNNNWPELLSELGLSLGDIRTGWKDQGSIVGSFAVLNVRKYNKDL